MIQRLFPPDHLASLLARVHAKIRERPNPERRMRTCPQRVKRARHNSYRVKRPGNVGVVHASAPTILLEGLPAAA